MNERKYDLEDRFVKFAGDVILFAKELPNDKAGGHLGGQIIRSSSSTALNFGEAQGTNTLKDKINKLSIVLKELKETRVALKILDYIKYGNKESRDSLMKECGELIAISATIIKNKNNLLK